jgi:uncharacterized protein YjbI with pentapeptide repeats
MYTMKEKDRIKLSGADMTGQNLAGWSAKFAILSRIRLSDANLEGADLEGANLRSASLIRAYLADANLNGARIHKTHFDRFTLNKVDLSLTRA